jgi:hypothetical protein
MVNISVTIKRGEKYLTYPSCREMIVARTAYLFSFSYRKYEKLVELSEVVEQTEDILAAKYDLPIGSLYGSHLLFGCIPRLIASLEKQEVREKLVDPYNRYSIVIDSITRRVKVYCQGRYDPAPYHVKNYKIRHSLYSIATDEERQQIQTTTI